MSEKTSEGGEMTPREHLDDIKLLFVEGKLSVEDARYLDTHWRTRLIYERSRAARAQQREQSVMTRWKQWAIRKLQ